MGICALCRGDTKDVGPLRMSHIIPRFLLMKTKHKGRALYVHTGPEKFEISQEDWTEELLCDGCEARMKSHEDYLNQVLFLRRGLKVSAVGKRLSIVHADADRVHMALISILWRSAISTRREFYKVFLPVFYAEQMRQWLLNDIKPSIWRLMVATKIQEVRENKQRLPIVLIPFMRKRTPEPPWDYVFICGGFCFTFSMPSPFLQQPEAILPGGDRIRIPAVEITDIPEAKEMYDQIHMDNFPPKVRVEIERVKAQYKKTRK